MFANVRCAEPAGRAAHNPGMVRVLAVSDEADAALWHDVRPVRGVQVILACGDLGFDYLGYLVAALDVPLVFVPGNHDPELGGYNDSPTGLTLRAGLPAEPPWPAGALNADRRVVDVAGLRIAGLGGCRRYGDGPNQYSDRKQSLRARGLVARAGWRRLRDGRPVDIVVTHAPPRNVGDGDDPAHLGFRGLHRVVERLQPTLLLHGHIHPYGAATVDHRLGRTLVRNVVGRHVFDVEPRVATSEGAR